MNAKKVLKANITAQLVAAQLGHIKIWEEMTDSSHPVDIEYEPERLVAYCADMADACLKHAGLGDAEEDGSED